MKLLIAIGVVLSLGMAAGLALHVPGADVLDPAVKPWFVAVLALCAAVWGCGVWVLRRTAVPMRAVWVGLAWALALRVVLLPVTPFLSSDVYRYVWDGRVQAAGENPYRYVPADQAVAGLRDKAVYPHINRAETAPTIYAPAAQVVFAVAAFVAPGVTGMKAVMVGFEVLAVLCLLRLLAQARRPAAWVLIYAFNPLVLWAFAGNGHVDAIGIGLIFLAMLLGGGGWAGAVLALAVLTKFLPAVVFPALWRGWRMPVAAAAVVAGMYGIYAGAGWRVLGFLPGYAPDEGLLNGAGIWLLAGFAPVPGWVVAAYGGAMVLALAWLAWRRVGPEILAAGLTVAISPHYPWYFGWLAAFSVLRPAPWLLWLSAAPVLLYVNPWGGQFAWASFVYVPALGLAVWEMSKAQ